MTIEFMEGAIYTLIAILLGCVVGALVAVVVLADRDPGPGSDDDPDPQPIDPELEDWLRENSLYEPFESDLRP